MSDVERDPTRTEDVEGRTVEERMADLVHDECPFCEKAHSGDMHTEDQCVLAELMMSAHRLRERLEEVEEERERLKRKVNKWIFRRSAARRRVDRLEEALRAVQDRVEHAMGSDGETQSRHLHDARGAILDALDSREDEGEDCTCGREPMGGGMVRNRDPDCPVHGYDADATGSASVHADEPEGDEEHDEVLAGELDWLAKNCRMNAEDAQGRGDTDMVVLWSHAKDVARRAARQIRERGRPTDEPVSREGVYDEVRAERRRQDDEWGPPEKRTHLSATDLSAIVAEEAGELAEAALESDFAGSQSSEKGLDLRREAIQVAASGVLVAEVLDAGGPLYRRPATHADARSSKTPDLEERTIAGSLRYLKRHAEKKRQYGIAAGIGDVLCRLSDSDGRAEDEDG